MSILFDQKVLILERKVQALESKVSELTALLTKPEVETPGFDKRTREYREWEERELVSLVEREVAGSIGQWQGDLAGTRAKELEYYNSEPFGNEVDGESQVVSSDVFDTVEGMLPSLLRIFTSSDDVVQFQATGPEDEEAAKQRTDLCNYVFYKQNNGFLILYEWFKDALIQKNGIVKYWWDHKISTTKESYADLSEGQYLKFKQDDDVEILSETAHDDETVKEQRDQQLQQVLAQVKQQAQGNRQVEAQLTQQITERINQIPIPKLYDVEIRVTKDESKVCIETVPPEEFGISAKHKSVTIQDTNFCYHKKRITISELREMGCPEEVIAEVGGGDDRQDLSQESVVRDRFMDQTFTPFTETDPTMRHIWVTDCFMRVDWDDDGIAELRHIIKAGAAIWINEETDHINFATLTPIIMPHRWIGKSAAELVMNDQFTKSVIWRQMLNNLYLTNNPRKAVLSSPSGVVQANLDDLMNSRAGGIMREYVSNAIRNEETPFVAGAAFPMLEYIDSQKEVRTGQTRYSQGTDADSLNKTARGIQMIQQAGQQRGDLIARIFAETGVKELMKGIAYMLSKYSTKEMTVRLRNKWVEVDPREWKNSFDMTINVGLGTGNKDVQIAHLNAMHQQQLELMQTGKGYMVSEENIFNLYTKMAEAMGFKHPEMFVSDPRSIDPRAKQPPPNPEMLKLQQADAEVQKKIQSNEKIRQFDAQTNKELEGIKAQSQIAIANIHAETQKQINAMKMQHEAQIAVFQGNGNATDQAKLQHDAQLEVMRQNFEKWKAELQASVQLQIAEMSAKTQVATANMTANTEQKKLETSVAQKDGANTQKLAKTVMDTLTAVNTAVAAQAETIKGLEQTVKVPKGHRVVRDRNGQISGLEAIQ